MLLVSDSYEEFAGMKISIQALPQEVCVGGVDK